MNDTHLVAADSRASIAPICVDRFSYAAKRQMGQVRERDFARKRSKERRQEEWKVWLHERMT